MIDTANNADCDIPEVTTASVDGTSNSGLELEGLEVLEDTDNVGEYYGDETVEDWEEEIHDCLAPETQVSGNESPHTNIRSWQDLREQIKADLKKHYKNLTLTQINQFLILRNFATLRIKGLSRISASMEIAIQWHDQRDTSTYFARRVRALARHYQIFEQLLPENRGGTRHAHSLLNNEIVYSAARSWLTAQPIGSVTPRRFRQALEDEILPALGVTLIRPPCERTAQRWLVKLGWVRTQVRKGVYMDGHEREDVVDYRTNFFLPKMEEFERRMAHYIPDSNGILQRIEPNLNPGERELIAEFQDETCCHANEYLSSIWSVHLKF